MALLVAIVVAVLLTNTLGWLVALVATLLGTVLLQVLASDVDRDASRIGVKVVRLAALLIPAAERQDYIDEWTDDVLSCGPVGIRPLRKAIGIALLGAPLIARLTRYGLRRRVSTDTPVSLTDDPGTRARAGHPGRRPPPNR
jgi:hypothetical protein